MKGIILAGGTGLRFFPLTKVTNKHLLPVGKYPMIEHLITKIKQAGIEEKPEVPKSNYYVTGIYMYDHRVFDSIKNLKPSGRGELEITDVNNWYIQDKSFTYDILIDWWTDAGTFESLTYANDLAKKVDLEEVLV